MLEIRSLSKKFGSKVVIDGADLDVTTNSFTVVCGEPGNGKSVFARLICGLEDPDDGRIVLGGRDLTDVPPGKRGIGYVPQSFALFPQFDVAGNIGHPLRMSGVDKATITEKVAGIASMLGVRDILAKRVDQISGGQKQRVAMARGLIRENPLYILDDPLVGLDFKLREQLVEDLRLLQQRIGATFLYFTSEPLEAIALADTVGVLSDGRFVEIADMPDAYTDPQHLATALTLGFPRANRIAARVVNRDIDTEVVTKFFTAKLRNWTTDLSDVELVIRPEDLALRPPGDGEAAHVAGSLHLIEDLGGESIIYISPEADHQLLTAIIGSDAPELSTEFHGVWIDPAALMVFDPLTGQRISSTTGAHDE